MGVPSIKFMLYENTHRLKDDLIRKKLWHNSVANLHPEEIFMKFDPFYRVVPTNENVNTFRQKISNTVNS